MDISPAASHLWVVDHVDAETAAVEVDGGALRTVPLWLLPAGVREGDVYRVTQERRGDSVHLQVTKDETERLRRLQRSAEQTAIVSPNDRPGDIVL